MDTVDAAGIKVFDGCNDLAGFAGTIVGHLCIFFAIAVEFHGF